MWGLNFTSVGFCLCYSCFGWERDWVVGVCLVTWTIKAWRYSVFWHLISLYKYLTKSPWHIYIAFTGYFLPYLCLPVFMLLYGFCVPVTESWHWSGIQTKTQTTRRKQRGSSKSCQRHMKFSQMVRFVCSGAIVKRWIHIHTHMQVFLKTCVLSLASQNMTFVCCRPCY